jgi:four helix bundle protein
MYNFEKLKVYGDARKLASAVYKLTSKFPKDEAYILIAQIRRAIVSVVLNIAEGSIKTKKDFARFIDISAGSLLEVRVGFQLATDFDYVSQREFEGICDDIDQLFKQLMSLRRYLRS